MSNEGEMLEHHACDRVLIERPETSGIVLKSAAVGLLILLGGVSAWAAPLDASATPPVPPAATGAVDLLSPPRDGGPVVVRTAFHLHDLDDINDVEETFAFTGVLMLTWNDPRLTFDPLAAGVAEKCYQGDYQFNEIATAWYPQVVLANVSGLFEQHAVMLRVKPSGECTLHSMVNAVAESKLDMHRYPFDRQDLHAVFAVFGFDTNEVVLVVDTEAGPPGGPNIHVPEWDLHSLESSTRAFAGPHAGQLRASSAFVLTMSVSRQPLFLLRLVIVPLILIVVLSWSVFWMDRASLGDRMSVSFVGILTAVAYQIVVGGVVPHISYVTLTHAFLNVSFWVMGATVVINLLVGVRDQRGDTAGGDRIDRRCRVVFPLVYVGAICVLVLAAFLMF